MNIILEELTWLHSQRCYLATVEFNRAFRNWHASIILERHSEPERRAELDAARARLRECLDIAERELAAP